MVNVLTTMSIHCTSLFADDHSVESEISYKPLVKPKYKSYTCRTIIRKAIYSWYINGQISVQHSIYRLNIIIILGLYQKWISVAACLTGGILVLKTWSAHTKLHKLNFFYYNNETLESGCTSKKSSSFPYPER